jgi:hypothetical protein
MEYSGYFMPYFSERYGMMGPRELMNIPYNTKEKQYKKK